MRSKRYRDIDGGNPKLAGLAFSTKNNRSRPVWTGGGCTRDKRLHFLADKQLEGAELTVVRRDDDTILAALHGPQGDVSIRAGAAVVVVVQLLAVHIVDPHEGVEV